MEGVLKFLCVSTILIISVQCNPIRHGIKERAEDQQEINEQEEQLSDRSRLLGFLNGLNTLGGLVGSRPIGGSANRNPSADGVPATTPRLSGRPGLGFIPDISKGINTILSGVATGNLEKVLEGSFVFAPNNVQLVAGNVLDRVFLSSTPSTNGKPALAQATTSRSLTSQEAQKQLLQIIQEQQQKINALEKTKKMEAGIMQSQK